MAKKILAVLEQREGKLKRSAFEVVSIASKIASELQAETHAVVVGNIVENLNDIGKYGISKITHIKNSELDKYSTTAYSDLISDFAKETDAEYLLLSNTSLGKDLAPHLAARLNAGIIMDIVELNTSSGELTATRPVFAGKALQEIKFKSEKKVLTIRPNVFKPHESENAALPEVEVREVSSPNLKSKVTEYKKSEGKLDVAEADIIVSGGRGLKEPQNFKLIEDLAEVLGAAVGASRAVVDAGWRPHREQVGQTGKTVSPSLYIACGISGA